MYALRALGWNYDFFLLLCSCSPFELCHGTSNPKSAPIHNHHYQGFFSTRTLHFRAIKRRNYAFLWPTMRNAAHFKLESMRSVTH